MRTLFSIALTLATSVSAHGAGDVEYGAYLSSECVTCHKISGSAEGIPPISGWETEAFVAVLNSYKNKERDNPTMQVIAERLDMEQMEALAAYFMSLGAEED